MEGLGAGSGGGGGVKPVAVVIINKEGVRVEPVRKVSQPWSRRSVRRSARSSTGGARNRNTGRVNGCHRADDGGASRPGRRVACCARCAGVRSRARRTLKARWRVRWLFGVVDVRSSRARRTPPTSDTGEVAKPESTPARPRPKRLPMAIAVIAYSRSAPAGPTTGIASLPDGEVPGL